MGIGRIDPEYAVREGWARDSDDEIYMDGYNAFIQISTRDGTSGFQVKNDYGGVAFFSKSDGDGYVAKDLSVGFKTTTLRLQVSEGSVTNYVLTSDAQGNATWQPTGGSADVTDLEGAVQTILKDLDGYHPDITGQEHYHQHSEAIQAILVALDGYGAGGGTDVKVKVSANDTTAGYLNGKLVAGTGVTLTENNDGGNETLTIDAITDLDGYLTDGYHRELDQLVHLISEDSFEEITYVAGNKVSSMVIWTDAGKTKKIREEQYTYDSWNRITQILSIQYSPAGAENERMVETLTYDGINVTSITRDVTIT